MTINQNCFLRTTSCELHFKNKISNVMTQAMNVEFVINLNLLVTWNIYVKMHLHLYVKEYLFHGQGTKKHHVSV